MARGRKKSKVVEEPIETEENFNDIGVSEASAELNDVELDMEDCVVEEEAIVPDEEVTEEMKEEEPVNKPESAIEVRGSILSETFQMPNIVPVKNDFDDYQKIFNEDYFNSLKEKGCDYQAYGKWQHAYASMFTRTFGLRNKTLLDVGAAYGAITFGFKMNDVMAIAVDVAKCLNGKTFRGIRFINESAHHMKSVDNKTIDFVHGSYVLNHLSPELLKTTFVEFKRVLKDGGKVLVIFNAGDDSANADMAYFKHSNETVIKAAADAGLKVVDYTEQLRHCDDPEHRFIQSYNWNILCFE